MFDSYADIFEKRGAAYHSAMMRWPSARDAEFVAAVEPLRAMAPRIVFDMPSGGGYLASYLDERSRYVGIEPASDFFSAWPDGLERVNADIKAVPLGDASTDTIVSLAGLHHERDLDAVFREFRRLLRPGGRLVIADVAEGTRPALFLNGFVNQTNPMGHDGLFLRGDAAAKLKAAGLTLLEDRLVDVPWRFSTRGEAARFARELFWMERATVNEVEEALSSELGFKQADGKIQLHWELRRIVCRA